jgi:TRAP-type C4-dicarboxylate transport system substrate-binding protein
MDTAADGTYITYPYERFQKWVEKATDGRVVIKTTIEMLDDPLFGAIEGRVDIGYERQAWVSGTFPLWDVATFPFFWQDSHEYEAAMDDPRMKAIYDRSYAEAGLIKMFEGPSGAMEGVYSNQKFETVESLKGAKLRSAGLNITNSMKLLGAAPLTMPVAELVDALMRGTVDGIHTGRAFAMEVGITDVAKYYSIWPLSSDFMQVFAMNKAKFDSLPPDLQAILLDVFREMNGQSFVGGHEAKLVAVTAIRATPIEMVPVSASEIDKAVALVVPAVFDMWLENAGPDGPEVLAIASQYATGPAAIAYR